MDLPSDLLVVQTEMFVPWCSSGAPVQLLFDSEKWSVWKPRFSKGKQRKAAAISQQHCPWSGQGATLQGHKKGAVSFFCHWSGFGKVHPTLTPHQHPSQWVAPSHQIYEKSLTQMLFLWEDSFWWMLGRSADSPRWAPVVFSEHWMLYLSHLVKLQCYHWEFQLHNYILHFEETANAWINVDFLGLSLIFSKSPPGTIKREVIVCINYTYAPFVIPLQGQKDIRRYTNTRPSVWIASVWVRQEMEGICSDKTWCLSPALGDLLSSAVLRYSLQIIFEVVIQGEKG